MRSCFILFTTLALALGVGSGWAKMYKWVDQDGQTHYTQTPPPEDAVEQSNVEPPPPRAEPADQAAERYQNIRKNLQEDIEAGEKTEEEQAKSQEKAKEQAERCKKAKTWRRQLQGNARLREVNEDGEYEILDDSVRQERLKKANDLVEKECGN